MSKPKGEEAKEEQGKEEGTNAEPYQPVSAVKVVLITLLVIFLIVISALAAGGYYVYTNLQPVDPESSEMIEIDIPSGSSVSTIASILEENGLIQHDQIFYYYVRYKGATGFQAGEYFLSPSYEYDQIITQMTEGQKYADPVYFTIPEGLTMNQIAVRLDEEDIVDGDVFLEVANEGDFNDISIVNDIPDADEREFRLEGILYPKRYEIHQETDEEEIIRLMLEQFEQELEQLPEGWEDQLDEQGMTLYEAIILASIIERETSVAEERKRISGVYHNRMEEAMRLEADATVQFALGEQRDPLLYEDLETESLYNTYRHHGLPPGPIASPGLPSIEAAIFPDHHEYLFYVTKKDGSGEHYFAETYAEHEENDAKSRENLEQEDNTED